jgi:hypothetical protein
MVLEVLLAANVSLSHWLIYLLYQRLAFSGNSTLLTTPRSNNNT